MKQIDNSSISLYFTKAGIGLATTIRLLEDICIQTCGKNTRV